MSDLQNPEHPAAGYMVVQIISLIASIIAIIWGVALAFAVAFPGPSGEWAAIGVFFAYIVNFPVGAVTLLLALVTKRGSPRLRRFCIIAATIALLLPLMVNAIDRYNTRWKYKMVSLPDASHQHQIV